MNHHNKRDTMEDLPHLLSYIKYQGKKIPPFAEKEPGAKLSSVHSCAWKNLLLIYIHINQVRSARKMMGFTQIE